MAVLSSIEVLYYLDPRVILVKIPEISVTVQDVHDTLRSIEDEPQNMVYPSLISTAGKEDLGGGVTVGLTATLLNAKIGFESRKIFSSSGTVTTGDATGINLIDNSATFITDGIQPGSWVVNNTDLSMCTVFRVVSETELYTDALDGGSDNQFQIGDVYSVYPVIQCEITGGNLVAVDSLGASLDPVFPTAGTQVVRTSSSSATLQELQDIQFSSFDGAVHVVPTSPYSGTTYPTGTPRQPVNNFVDGLSIANTRGLKSFKLTESVTVNSGLDFEGFSFIGSGRSSLTVTVSTAAQVQGCQFDSLTIQGVLDGSVALRNCQVENLSYVDGTITNCSLRGTITLSGSQDASLIECWDGISGSGTPIIDFGGSGSSLIIRSFSGGIELLNNTGTDNVSVDLESGRVILDSTFGGTGQVIIRGVGEVVDEGHTATSVDTSNLVNPNTVADAVFEEDPADHESVNTYGRTLGRGGIR